MPITYGGDCGPREVSWFPSQVNKSIITSFSLLKSKFWAQITKWREKPLFKVDKEILIKSMLYALPTCVMSLYLLPTTFHTTLERIMNRYWWVEMRTSIEFIGWIGSE